MPVPKRIIEFHEFVAEQNKKGVELPKDKWHTVISGRKYCPKDGNLLKKEIYEKHTVLSDRMLEATWGDMVKYKCNCGYVFAAYEKVEETSSF